MVKVISFLNRILKRIDMYGSKIEMNFQRQQIYKTVFGGIITLIIFILFGLGCWFFGYELIAKRKPAVITSQRSVESPARIDINENNLIMMIGVSNFASQLFIDESIYSIKAVQETMVLDQSINGIHQKRLKQKQINLKICDQNNIGIEELGNYFQDQNSALLYCFDQNQKIYMEGDYDANQFAQVYIYIERCQNSTISEVECKSPEEIDKKLKLSKIQLYLSDKIVDPLNLNNPFINKGINLYSPLSSSSFQKELQVYFTNYYIQSDVGLIQRDIKYDSSFVFTEMKETIFSSEPNQIARVLFRIQKQKEYLMQRSYQKFADIVAQIGGLLKILTTFGALISTPFSRLYLFKSIVDELFSFGSVSTTSQLSSNKIKMSLKELKTPSPKQTKKGKKKKEEKQINSHQFQDIFDHKKIPENNSKEQIQGFSQYNNVINLTRDNKSVQKINSQKQGEKSVSIELSQTNQPQISSPISQRRNSLIDKVKEYFQVSYNTIKYKFPHYFMHICLKKCSSMRQQHKLIDKGISQIIGHLDVLFIINKLLEIDKLKTILLNQDQLRLFEYIPKPHISNESKLYDSENIAGDSITQMDEIDKREQIRLRNLLFNSQKLYSINKRVKTGQEKAFDAYEGLQGIVKKEKCSKIDLKLIELINPMIRYKFKIFDETKQISKSKNQLKQNSNSNIVSQLNFNSSNSPFNNYQGRLSKQLKSFENSESSKIKDILKFQQMMIRDISNSSHIPHLQFYRSANENSQNQLNCQYQKKQGSNLSEKGFSFKHSNSILNNNVNQFLLQSDIILDQNVKDTNESSLHQSKNNQNENLFSIVYTEPDPFIPYRGQIMSPNKLLDQLNSQNLLESSQESKFSSSQKNN